MNLLEDDIRWALNRVPKTIRDIIKEHPEVVIAGGFIRSCIAREPIADIDLFIPSVDRIDGLIEKLRYRNNGSHRIHKTENAITIHGYQFPVQVITRWTYPNPQAVLDSFDYSIARAVLWYGSATKTWHGECDPRFYADLAAKRLYYCAPQRTEDAGGSILRMLKFYQRGYTITLGSLAGVIARMLKGVPDVNWAKRGALPDGEFESQLSGVLLGLLREVDPLINSEHIRDAHPEIAT